MPRGLRRSSSRIRRWARVVAASACGLVLAGSPASSEAPSFPAEPPEGAPPWALDWIAGPRKPCRAAPPGSGGGPSSADLDAEGLTERADRLEAAGYPCAAAAELHAAALKLYRSDLRSARSTLARALALALQGDDPTLLALVTDLAENVETSERNVREALTLILAAQLFWQAADDFDEWCTARHDFSVLLAVMGRFDESEAVLRQLLEAIETARPGQHPILAATLTALARLETAKGQHQAAESLLQRALRAPENNPPHGRIATFDALCQLRIEQQDFRRADRLNQNLLRRVGDDRRARANLLATSAEIALGLKKPAEAVALAREARRALQRSAGEDPNLDFRSRFVEANAERALGHGALADASMEALMAGLEAYRQAGHGDLIVPLLSMRRQLLSAWVDDLLTQRRIADSFDVAEWTRARGLLDGLVWPPAEVRAQADAAAVSNDLRLRQELAELGSVLEKDAAAERATEALGAQARQLRLALLSLEAEMRQRAGVQSSAPIDLEGAQALLEDGTVALVYWLGERRSSVWMLDRNRVQVSTDLPARRPLEQAALRLRQLLSQGAAAEAAARSELQALGKALLDPVAGRLGDARTLVVVPDGALAEIPFALLHQPPRAPRPGAPLIETVPVAVVHSLSVVAAIRARAAERARAQTTTLVAIADPVYSPDDPRLGLSRRPLAASAKPRPRLEGTGREARAAVASLPRLEARLFADFDASRERVVAGALAGSRYVQIGAHTVLHWDQPELSAIYLSELDSRGRRVDGALRLQDLDRLQLSAELVVLAGCETAIGRSYLGEGPLSLPRGFLLAGAASVVASLWPVGDEATAELVERLWHGILRERRSPAEALRVAQLELAGRAGGSRPADWAAFVLLGDWAGDRAKPASPPTNPPGATVSTPSTRR